MPLADQQIVGETAAELLGELDSYDEDARVTGVTIIVQYENEHTVGTSSQTMKGQPLRDTIYMLASTHHFMMDKD